MGAYRFGRFELRPATRQLLVDEQPTTLGARAFNLLLALVERRERLIAKDELFELVWPGLVVEENNLQVQISALRKILGHDAIATVPGHGYRFTLETTEAAAPGPSPASAAKHNLPTPVASFIGRARELTDLRAMLSRHRCVTLTGVGGIGKTRLALELGTLVADAHAEGAWFVDLAPVSDGGLVANAVASTLGVREEPGRPVLEALLKFVHDRALLLLLDNCEHLLHACAQLTRDLLQAGQKLTIVATSREPLHVAGEATFPLPTLPTPDPRDFSLDALRDYAAVQLFVDRAIAVRRDFALTRQNAAAVARICHDLDGIPLAIELAAARMRAMSAEVIAGHLTDRFRLLKSGDLTVLPRQQTLRATIDWSYQLLASAERALLHRLSIFSGGFALDGAEAVGAGGDVAAEDVLELLANLVDKSLVAFDAAADRYKLLETVRQYAQEHLTASGEEAGARDRHLAFYVAFAERALPEIRTSRQAALLARIEAERDNIANAFAHARIAPDGGPAGLAMVHPLLTALRHSHWGACFRMAREALAHPGAQEESVARARALYASANIDYWAGRYDEALDKASESVRIARKHNDSKTLADGLKRLGNACIELGKSSEARQHYSEVLELARAIDDRPLISDAHCGLGELYSIEGQLELAQTHYREALACKPDERDSIAVVNCNFVRNAVELGERKAAIRHLRDAMAMLGATPEDVYIHMALCACGGLATLYQEWTRAIRFFGAAASHRERAEYRPPEPDHSFLERRLLLACEAAGATVADEAFAAGSSMSSQEAWAEAVEWVESLP